jgi:hypothetical protein
MADTSTPTVAPDVPPRTPLPICLHVWVTAAPYQARCTLCGFVAPITTEEV